MRERRSQAHPTVPPAKTNESSPPCFASPPLRLHPLAAFGEFGTIERTFAPAKAKFTFVHFEDKYDAEKAIEALDGTSIAGAKVKVTDGKCANREVEAWRAKLVKA